MKIIKIEYEDGTIEELKIVPMEEIKTSDNPSIKYHKKINYTNQFRKFEEKILGDLEKENVINFAKYWFDLIDEDECECECEEGSMLDYCDYDLIEECCNRNIVVLKTQPDIRSKALFSKFEKLYQTYPIKEVEKILDLIDKQ